METLYVLKLPEMVFWLLISGMSFSVVTLIFFVDYFRKEKNVLMVSFLGFLGGISLLHLFGAASIFWKNPFYMYIGGFGGMIGSTLVVRFPILTIRDEIWQRRSFYFVFMMAGLLSIWMVISKQDPLILMKIASLHIVVFSGVITGSHLIWTGFHLNDPALRIKCIGGGCSIFLGCFFSHVVVFLVGFTTLAKIFMVGAPIALMASVMIGRLLLRQKHT